ncbi:MAG TPA: hypothetical protein VES20_07250 [Bryobacteraceae bacterium]|nr:hypothetical protein [Bryobacteraceae bacterium]
MRLYPLLALLPVMVLAQSSAGQQTYSISTWAGRTWTGDGKSATGAVLLQPRGIAIAPDGTMYVADAADHRVRKITPGGMVSTVAGTGSAGFSGENEPALRSPLNSPFGLALDVQGNLYIADLDNARVRKLGPDGRLLTIAGGGDERPQPYTSLRGIDAKLNKPRGVAVDWSGNVYIADFGAHMIYQVTPGGMLTVVAGTGANSHKGQDEIVSALNAELSAPSALAIDSKGAIFIADSGNGIVRKLQGGVIAPLRDPRGTEITFGLITGIAVDHAGRLYVADGDQITLVQQSGAFEKLAVTGYAVAVTGNLDVYTAADKQVFRLVGTRSEAVAGTAKGPGAGDGFIKEQWRFASPVSLVRDIGGHILISDRLNGRIRRISPSGELSTLTTKLKDPGAMALDKESRLYVDGNSCINRVDLSGQVTCVYDRARGRSMVVTGMVFDKTGNLFIADSAGLIHRLTAEGSLTIAAGGGPSPDDGPALLVHLAAPSGVGFDAAGNLWFTEAATGRLRYLRNGRIHTAQKRPELSNPCGLRFAPDGSMYIPNCGNHRVVRVWPEDGSWLPVAGSGHASFSGDGEPALSAGLNAPQDVLPMPDGTVLIADTGNDRIRRLTPLPAEPSAVKPAQDLQYGTVAVRHAATLRTGGDVAPGQLVYVQMDGITRANGVQFSGQPGTLLAASENQLTVRAPMSIVPGPVEVWVTEGTSPKARAALNGAFSAPGILTAQGGVGQALVSNENGTLNAQQNPAARGSVVSFYLTGEGDNLLPPKVRISGTEAEVVWYGRAPDMAGVFQINVRTPAGFAPSGVVSVEMTVNGVATQPGVTMISR